MLIFTVLLFSKSFPLPKYNSTNFSKEMEGQKLGKELQLTLYLKTINLSSLASLSLVLINLLSFFPPFCHVNAYASANCTEKGYNSIEDDLFWF